MKYELSLSAARRLLDPGPVVLVTSFWRGQPNIMTAAWAMPVSLEQPLVAVAISPLHFTHELIEHSESFVLNVPGRPLLDQILVCGTRSGRAVDKFEVAKLQAIDAREVEAPLVEQCLAHIECAVDRVARLGDHTLFVGRALAITADSDAFAHDTWLLEDEDRKPLHYLGGDGFAVLERRLTAKLPEEETEAEK